MALPSLLTLTPAGKRNLKVLAALLAAALVLASLHPTTHRLLASAGGGEGPPTIQASPLALRDIPLDMLGYYVTAAREACPELDWQLLAGIGKVETNHGQSDAPGVTSGLNRAGCCAGPMQFNLTNGPPSTWDGVGRDYNGDGKTNVYDPADAIPAAAHKLCANGIHPTPENRQWEGVTGADPCPQVRGTAAVHRALRRYNNACWYADQVLEMRQRYTSGKTDPLPAAHDTFLQALVDHPRIHTTASHGCQPEPDLASGKLDVRVRGLLALLASRWEIRLSCVQSGHSKFVKGSDPPRVSNHHVWRAIDIDVVNGQPVNHASPAAKDLVEFLNQLSGVLRPSEVGSPWQLGADMYFSNAGHQGHIHVGYSYQYHP